MDALLDHTPSDWQGRLWLGSREDGTHEICDEQSKGSRGFYGPPWNLTYREQIALMVRQIEGHGAFWLEFAQDHAANPLIPKAGDRVTIIAPSFHCYTAYVEQPGGEFSGFSGQRFDVEMRNGVTFWSENVSGRGLLPAHYRKLLKPNGSVKGLR